MGNQGNGVALGSGALLERLFESFELDAAHLAEHPKPGKSGAVKAADQGRWKRLETVRGYDRRAKLFDKHAGGDFL